MDLTSRLYNSRIYTFRPYTSRYIQIQPDIKIPDAPKHYTSRYIQIQPDLTLPDTPGSAIENCTILAVVIIRLSYAHSPWNVGN